jgi:uncharacterized protein (TIGR02421 family)
MTKSKISPEFTDKIIQSLANGKRIRRIIPGGGRLHIDRCLPFMIVYKKTAGNNDNGTERLIKGEASYLIAPPPEKTGPGLSRLINELVKHISKEYSASLIINVWAAEPKDAQPLNESGIHRPSFRIIASRLSPPSEAVQALERSLRNIKILKRTAGVEVIFQDGKQRKSVHKVISDTTARNLNCFTIGLEISPFYRDPETNEVFPLLIRRLHRGLSTAFKKCAFEFTRNRTNRNIVNYMSLGQRSFVKSVWDADKKLAEISQSFDFLLQVTPVNVEKAWKSFRKSRYERVPVFYYRPHPIDPAIVKRALYKIPLEKVEDATLSYLFQEKRKELDRQLTLLSDRGRKEFYYGSLQLYGRVSQELAQTAQELLSFFSDKKSKISGSRKKLNSEAFAQRAREEIAIYRKSFPQLNSRVEIRQDTVGLLVSRGNLLVSEDIKIPLSRVEAMLSHEIGTHVLTYYNGKAQPFEQLYCGLAGYDELQEGLAVLSEFLVGQLNPNRLRLLAGRVIAAFQMQRGDDFTEVFHRLKNEYGFENKTSFIITARIFRGGGLIKDAIYLRGLIKLLAYLKQGRKIDTLFCGKIALDHVPIIEDLQAREILKRPPLTPRYMQSADIEKKLSALRNGLDLKQMVNWR